MLHKQLLKYQDNKKPNLWYTFDSLLTRFGQWQDDTTHWLREADCVSIWYICVTLGLKRSDGPERWPQEGAQMRHLPTEVREGCPGLVGDACARQLDGGVLGRRLPHPRR